jgi:hypothetical protein
MANLDNISSSLIGGGAGTTKEIVYLLHLLKTLDTVQSCFDNGSNDAVQLQRFNLLVMYLQNTVLNKAKRDSIKEEMRAEEERLKKENKYDETTIEFMLGFIVVREVMQYLNDIVEFEHSDIVGMVNYPKDVIPEKTLADDYELEDDDILDVNMDSPENMTLDLDGD